MKTKSIIRKIAQIAALALLSVNVAAVRAANPTDGTSAGFNYYC